LGGGFDGNVLRTDVAKDELPEEARELPRRGGYYESRLELDAWLLHDGPSFVGVTLSGDGRRYADPKLLPLARLETQVDVRLGLGDPEASLEGPAVAASFDGIFGNVALGGKRVVDRHGARVTLGSPAFHELSLSFTALTDVESKPHRDVVLDPIEGELAEATDFGRTERLARLGFSPWEGAGQRVELAAEGAETQFADESSKELGTRVVGGELGYELRPNARAAFLLEGRGEQRSFPSGEDEEAKKRRDRRLGARAVWRWHYTPAFYHELEAGYERQRSPREESAYRRATYDLMLHVDF
jgi:hypothetical protein